MVLCVILAQLDCHKNFSNLFVFYEQQYLLRQKSVCLSKRFQDETRPQSEKDAVATLWEDHQNTKAATKIKCLNSFNTIPPNTTFSFNFKIPILLRIIFKSQFQIKPLTMWGFTYYVLPTVVCNCRISWNFTI